MGQDKDGYLEDREADPLQGQGNSGSRDLGVIKR